MADKIVIPQVETSDSTPKRLDTFISEPKLIDQGNAIRLDHFENPELAAKDAVKNPAYTKGILDSKIFSPLANFIGDTITKDESEKFRRSMVDVFKPENLRAAARATIKGLAILADEKTIQISDGPVGIGLETKGKTVSTQIDEEEAKAFLRTGLYLPAQLSRVVTPIQASVGAMIDKKDAKSIAQAATRGFLFPEEVDPIFRKILPLTKAELEADNIASLIPRAAIEAIETVALFSVVFGGSFKSLKKLNGKSMTKAELKRIQNIIPKLEEAGVKFPTDVPPAVKSRIAAELGVGVDILDDKVVSFIVSAQKDTSGQVGRILARAMETPAEVFAGVPIPFKAGDVVKFGKELAKIISIDGANAVLSVAGKEVTAKLAELGPQEAEVKPGEGAAVEGEQPMTKEELARLDELEAQENLEGEELAENIALEEKFARVGAKKTESIAEKGTRLKNREAKREGFKAELEEAGKVEKFLKGKVKKFAKGLLAEELEGLPRGFFTTKSTAMTLDEALVEVNDADLGVKFANTEELVDFIFEDRIRIANLKELIADVSPVITKKQDITLFKDKLKNIQRGIREGKIAARKEVAATQGEVIRFLKESVLTPKDKAKFIPTIRKLQTPVQLSNAVSKIAQRVAGIEEANEKRTIINKIKKMTPKTKLRNLRPEFQKPIVELVESFDPVKRTGRTLSRLKSLSEFIKREPENQIPQKALNRLDILDKTPIDDMSVEDLQLISNSIDHLVKLNELKNKLIIKGKLRTFEKVKNESLDNINTRHEKAQGSVTGLDTTQQEVEAPLWKKIFGADSYNAELKTEILDGMDKGIIQQVVFKEIDEGVNVELNFEHAAQDFFKEKLGNINMDKWSAGFQKKVSDLDLHKIEISGNRTITMTKGERIAFRNTALNDKGRKHLENGGFSFTRTTSKINKLTPEDVDAIAGSLTKNEVIAADALLEYYNTVQKDAINKVSVDLLGHDIATELVYSPLRTNALDRFKDELIKTGSFSQKTLEGLGIFKERQNASNAIILEDAFTAAYKSIKSVGAYVGLARPLRGAKALLNDNDFQKSIIEVGRQDYLRSLKAYIARVEDNAVDVTNIERLTQELINKLDTSLLGLNPFVMLKQTISYPGAGTEIDPKFMRGNILPPNETELAQMRTHPQIRDRLDGNISREVGEVGMVGRPKKFFTGKEVISQKYMGGIKKFDSATVTGIFRDVKREVSFKQPDLKGKEFIDAVVNRTWDIIRRTQPTFHVKDRSTIGMEKDIFIRLGTKFSSQRNKNWMILRRAYEKYNRSGKKAKDKSDLAATVFLITAVNALLIASVNALRGIVFRKKTMEQIFKKFWLDLITVPFGNIYFLGDGITSLASKIDKGTYAGFDVNNPVSSFVNEVWDTVAFGVESIKGAITQERYKAGKFKGDKKWLRNLGKFTENALVTVGTLKAGIPVRSILNFLLIPFRKQEKPKRERATGRKVRGRSSRGRR